VSLYRVKSQLYSDAESQLKGAKQILDDCTWSSCAAAVSWASGYTVDYSAAEAVIVMKKVTGRKDVQGKSDNGGSQSEAVKVIAALGGKARWAKSWEDAMAAGKAGAALMIHVQQPVGYPEGVKISAWHDRWHKWWSKQKPEKIKLGYGHMVSAGWCEDHGWQWACPTRDEKVAAEKYGVPVFEAELRQIANSKVKARKGYTADYKTLLIVTHPGRVAAPAPVAAPVQAAPVQAAPVQKAPAPATIAAAPKKASNPEVDAALKRLEATNWESVGERASEAFSGAVGAAAKEHGVGNKIGAALAWVRDNTGLDEALLEAARVFLATSVAVALATGAPLLDMTGADLRTVVSGGLAAALNVLVRFLQPTDTQFGVGTKK
jgi:hypothetical protein